MKKFLFFLLLISLSNQAYSQEDYKWEFSISNGYQLGLNKVNEEFFSISGNKDQGVHQIGFYLKREILKQGKFSIYAGIGNSIERVASRIEINHCYGFTNCFGIYTTRKGYTVSLLEIPISIKYTMMPKLKLGLGIIPQFRWYQNEVANDSFSKFNFGLHAIENYLSVEYTLNKVNIDLGYRILNMRTINPIYSLGNEFIENSQDYYNQSLDFYNPVKLKLSIGFLVF